MDAPPAPSNAQPAPPACPVCHQPASAAFYFCPNCGSALRAAPLPTDSETQTKLYLFSVALPLIAFLFVSRWKGIAYVRSPAREARRIGIIACALLALSTAATAWYVVAAVESAVRQSVDDINAQMSL